MKITYAPQGGEPQVFQFDIARLTTDELEDLESVGGLQWGTFGEWANVANRGGWRAWRAGLWVMLKRQNPTLEFEQVKPAGAEMDVDQSGDDETPEPAEGKSETGDESTDSP